MRLFYTSPTGENLECTRPDLSLGGFKSSTVCPNNSFNNMFSDISAYSVSENVDELIGLMLVNESGIDVNDVILYFDYPENCQKHIYVAVVALNANGEMEVVKSPYNAPYNAEFEDPYDEPNSINIGGIPVDGAVGLWFKRAIDKDVIDAQYSDDELIANGNVVEGIESIVMNISWTHLPVLTTSVIFGITRTTAIGGGNVTSDGDLDVIAKGICWGTSENPTVSGSHTTDGIGEGAFTSNITGLTGNTIYYVRSYAQNSLGVSYGTQVSFTTSPIEPTVTTDDISDITDISAICGGNVTSDGGSDIIARGVCWSTSSNPTVDDDHTDDGTGDGTFESDIIGLTTGTIYHVRAYATNSEGTSYGTDKTFTTS
jgi:hypothetical protein